MEINFLQVLFQVVNFGVILFLLNKILYKPVLKLLDDRAKKINDGMAMAEKNIKEAGETEKLKKAELAKARKEANAIIVLAEKDAKAKADSIIREARAKAKAEAVTILDQANKEVEHNQAKRAKQMGVLATKQLESALGKTLTAKEIDAITVAMLKAK
jgi:F-type H+-transporting ATPase subunit b